MPSPGCNTGTVVKGSPSGKKANVENTCLEILVTSETFSNIERLSLNASMAEQERPLMHIR